MLVVVRRELGTAGADEGELLFADRNEDGGCARG